MARPVEWTEHPSLAVLLARRREEKRTLGDVLVADGNSGDTKPCLQIIKRVERASEL